jgi:ATP-binding cassette subfamily B protein
MMPGAPGPGGPMGFGGPATPTGLPFAGIPPEYSDAVDRLIEDEPEFELQKLTLDHTAAGDARFTLRSFLAPHWASLVVAAFLVSLDVIALQMGPKLLQLGIDHGVIAKDFQMLQLIVLIYFGSIAAHLLIARQRVLYTGRLGQRLMHALRVRVFTHLQRLSLDFFTREKAGRIMSRMTSDIPALEQLFQEGIVSLLVQGLTLLVITAILLQMNAQLTGVVLLAVVPAMLAITLWFRSASGRVYPVVRERIADVLADLQESLAGVRIISLANRQQYNVERHRGVVDDYRDANLDAARVAAIYGPSSDFVGVFGQIVVLALGGSMVYAGEISVGTVAAFVLYITAFFAPIQQLLQLYNIYQQGQAAAGKLREVFDTAPSVAEALDAAELPEIEGRIQFEHVTFGYDAARPVLRGLDLDLAPGETFSLVGETGAGKSTIAKLITRFYDPQLGTVRVDGVDLRDVRLDSLRRQLGVVPQEPFLFAGSIRDNIAFARPDASDDEVLAACHAVGIDELINRLPQGIDTPCHERGVTLSSGERQLIALARAFLSQPRVLILDEATSNLDLKTESLIERALDTLLEGRTAILIAHRLSTAMRADRIGVVEDGRISELGSHDELLALGGRYAALFATWNR